MIRLEHQITQRQEQRLVLTQQQLLGLNMLQMNTVELEQFLTKEVEQNPLLELVEPVQEFPKEPITPPESDVNDPSYAEDWENHILGRMKEGQDFSVNPDRFKAWEHHMDSVVGTTSLHAHLMGQLRASISSPEEERLGEFIIMQLDDRGYLTCTPAQMAEELGISEEAIREILRVIQSFEPTGVAAADLKECLLLQIDVEFGGDKALKALVTHHLEDLGHRRIRQIAKAMRITEQEVETLAEKLSTLEPRPGRQFSSSPTQAVTPEVIIQEIPEERRDLYGPKYEAVLASERLFHVELNNTYYREVQYAAGGSLDEETTKFLQEKHRAADALLKNLSRREQTLLRAAQIIAETQEEYLEKGDLYLKPLRLRDVAEKVGAHESTMSRAVSGKFILTPQGVIEMKRFFSVGLSTTDGEEQSSRAVQARIRQLIEGEAKSAPLSDQAIAEILQKEGVNIARRTVAKYREGMGIATSSQRRHYH